ncbi:hypothetical protein F2Q70_00013623 [Brassica cretica]|uniref:Uncharacterized protein n=1 Tax=Brassica cretica TaxID=69181 RepID=A0A8S9LSR9_BRACR|nr:hypothetical protein F2Q70_00013623 [Brassica cretica]
MQWFFLDLAVATETPKTVREGYCGAYLSFFHSCGLIFPVPEPILEILVELGLSLTQILPNFLRYLIAFLVRAREEGLSFGLSEFQQLVLVKRNQQNPGTFLVSPRPGRHVIEDIPYRAEKWREQFFVFKMYRASMGEFDFSRLPRSWAENITSFGSSSMSDGIHGLIRILRGGRSNWSLFDHTRIRTVFAMLEGINRAPLFGGYEDEAEHSQEVVVNPSVQAQSSDRLARQLVRRSSFRTSGSASREDETVTATRKRRRSSKGALPGPSRPRFVPEGDGSLFAAQGDLISLAGRMRSAGCCLPSLASSAEKKAYAKVAVASSKVMEAFNEYVVARIAALEVERDLDICCASRFARRDIATRYREILESLKDKWTSRKKGVSAEIQLHKVIANINLLNELKDGCLTVDAELARLKEMEGDCEDLVASAAVSDLSISELDLPQVSDDSVDQVGGTSVLDDFAIS